MSELQAIDNEIALSPMSNLKKYLRLQIEKKHKNILIKIYYLILFFIDIILRSIGQVFLCDNALSGLLILIGVGCSSIHLIICGIIGAIFANIGAYYFGSADMNDIASGMCGYDGVLTGCSCYVFLNHTDNAGAFIFILLFLSIITGFIHVSCTNFMKFYNLPALTMAFNLTILMFLVSLSQEKIELIKLSDSSNVEIESDYADMSFFYLLDATCRGVGQFIFADTTYGGIIIIIGIALESITGASCAILGSFLACITSYYILQVPDLDNVRNGLHGYCSAGVCASISGGIFFKFTKEGIILGIFGSIFAVLVLTTIQGILTPYSLPVCTVPFIVTTWIIFLSKSKLMVPHDNKILVDAIQEYDILQKNENIEIELIKVSNS